MAEFKFWLHLSRIVLSVIIFVAAVISIYTAGPLIETRFFPVFSKFTIVSAVETAPGVSTVVVEFDKLRDCSPGGFNWYIGTRDGAFVEASVIAITRNTGADTGRPLGRQRSAPFTINVPPALMTGDVFADVFSRCHPLWPTRSEVYP